MTLETFSLAIQIFTLIMIVISCHNAINARRVTAQTFEAIQGYREDIAALTVRVIVLEAARSA